MGAGSRAQGEGHWTQNTEQRTLDTGQRAQREGGSGKGQETGHRAQERGIGVKIWKNNFLGAGDKRQGGGDQGVGVGGKIQEAGHRRQDNGPRAQREGGRG